MDMSILTRGGGVPLKVAMPVMVPAVAGSTGVTAGGSCAVEGVVAGCAVEADGAVDDLQPAKASRLSSNAEGTKRALATVMGCLFEVLPDGLRVMIRNLFVCANEGGNAVRLCVGDNDPVKGIRRPALIDGSAHDCREPKITYLEC